MFLAALPMSLFVLEPTSDFETVGPSPHCFNYEAVELIHRNQELLQQMAKVAEARYSAGKAMQQDIIKAGIEVAIFENRLICRNSPVPCRHFTHLHPLWKIISS
jgi:hypothetical protein